MKRFLIAVGVALSLLVGSPAAASDFNDIFTATYKLYKNGTSNCSGQFVISNEEEDVFLTAAHCVRDKKAEYSIHTETINEDAEVIHEEVFYLDTFRTNKWGDTATLKVKTPEIRDFPTVDVAETEEADEALVLGKEIIVVGYPFTEILTLTDGLYTGRQKSPFKEITTALNRVTASITSGSSGGGLYTEIDGEWKLVGVATGVHPAVGFVNIFALPKSVNEVIIFGDYKKNLYVKSPARIIADIIAEEWKPANALLHPPKG